MQVNVGVGGGASTTALLRAGVVAGGPAGGFEVFGFWLVFFRRGEGKEGDEGKDGEMHFEQGEDMVVVAICKGVQFFCVDYEEE
jgi:hypothetical protein